MKWKENLQVFIVWDPNASSVCRCCNDRITGGVFLKVKKAVLVEALCASCYEAIRTNQKDYKFPALAEVQAKGEVCPLMPSWLVVQSSVVRYFIPRDTIDRGLMIQRAKRGARS